MKALIAVIMVSLCCTLKAQEYNCIRAHEDSMLIYQTYHGQIDFLERAANDSNYVAWYDRSALDDSLTNCAKLRLKKWNKQTYEPTATKEHEGFGTAFAFPEPAMKKVKFTVTDFQTKFITRADGKTKSPYYEKTYFDEGGVVINVEQLYPSR
jgi:hypothetical protein